MKLGPSFSETTFGSKQIEQQEGQGIEEQPDITNSNTAKDTPLYSPGMHVAAAWLKEDSTEYTWYLGELKYHRII